MWLNIFQYLLAILISFLSSDKLSSMCYFCLLILSFVILIYKNVLPKQINSCHELIYAYFKSLRFPIIFKYLCACGWLPWWLNDREAPCNAGNVGKEMSPHFIILAWKISWTEQPGRLPSMGFQKSRTWLSH